MDRIDIILCDFIKIMFQKNYYREWCKRNKEKFKEYRRSYREYYEKNKDKINERRREYDATRRKIPKVRLNKNVSRAVCLALRGNKAGRHWEDLVGYTLGKLKQRLSVNFKKGMTFENYGLWHIDHKKPISWFKYEKVEDQAFKDCWCLANLQPLWASENMSKNNHYKS